MNEIAGLPYIEAQFDQRGLLLNPDAIKLPPGVTDLLVASHGWDNSAASARLFYQDFFENFVATGETPNERQRRFGILGIVWPSTKLSETPPSEIPGLTIPSGVPEVISILDAKLTEMEAISILDAKLTEMEAIFTEPHQTQLLREARMVLPYLGEKTSARSEFVHEIRALLDPSPAEKHGMLKMFLMENPAQLLERLRPGPDDPDDVTGETLRGLYAAAWDLLQFTSYLEMRARAERIGSYGVARLIDQLAPQVQRLHLLGHGFGGRVVAAAAAHSTTGKLGSMSLLQTPISHSSFSRSARGFFRSIIDQKRVKGPILVTHAATDKTVDLGYSIAERIAGGSYSAMFDRPSTFGAVGRYGLQMMGAGEVIKRSLLPIGNNYSFESGKLFNLDVSEFVKDHADVTSKEIAQAVRLAVEPGLSLARGGATPPPKPSRKPKPVFLGFSVPRHAEPGITFAARFAAYIDSARKEVEEQLKALGDQGDRVISDIPPDSAPYWTVGAPITVRLTGDHVEVDPPERSFEWNGRKNLLSFVVRVAGEINEPKIQLRFQVFLGPVEVAFVPLNVDLASGVESTSTKTQTRRSPGSAFASYASKDAMLVAQKLSALIRFAPFLDIFQDALDLRPGEEFKPQIEQEIAKREAFFLFWSRNARASEWVHWELEIALTKRGKEAITLMPLEDPTIVDPPPGFESQQQRDRFMNAGYMFRKVQEIAGESP